MERRPGRNRSPALSRHAAVTALSCEEKGGVSPCVSDVSDSGRHGWLFGKGQCNFTRPLSEPSAECQGAGKATVLRHQSDNSRGGGGCDVAKERARSPKWQLGWPWKFASLSMTRDEGCRPSEGSKAKTKVSARCEGNWGLMGWLRQRGLVHCAAPSDGHVGDVDSSRGGEGGVYEMQRRGSGKAEWKEKEEEMNSGPLWFGRRQRQHQQKGHRGELIHYVANSSSGSTVTSSQKGKKKKQEKEEGVTLRTVLVGAVAGGTAGISVETLLYPIDTIKTRLQAARSGGGIVFKGLYSGLAGNLMGVLPASALFIGVYEPAKQKLLEVFPPHLSYGAHLTAGAIGGAAASLVRVPTEVVKQRMQTGQFASASGAVRGILAKEGIKGMYAGFGSFLLRDLPFDAIQFCMYEQLKLGLKRLTRRELRDGEMAAIGAVSGALTGAITTPLDVIKTRLMVQGTSAQYRGIADCISTVWREEGPRAFLKGVGPRVLWIGIGGSIFFGVLEKTKAIFYKVPELPLTDIEPSEA